MSEVKLNGQPLAKLQFNTDNFKRLKLAYEETLELLVKLNAKLTVEEKAVEDKPTTRKRKATVEE